MGKKKKTKTKGEKKQKGSTLTEPHKLTVDEKYLKQIK